MGKKRGQFDLGRYDKHSGSGSTLQDEISDGFGRVTQFSNTNSDPGDVYIQYSHIGSGRMVPLDTQRRAMLAGLASALERRLLRPFGAE